MIRRGIPALVLWAASALSVPGQADEAPGYAQGYEDARRDALTAGQRLPSDAYRLLGEERYRDEFGRRLEERLGYAEADDGTRLLIDLTTGIIADVLQEAHREDGADNRRGASRPDIPPGHYPPPRECRVWFPDRPPAHQPPPGSCNVEVPRGAFLIEG